MLHTFVLLLLLWPIYSRADIYVALNGNDAWSGHLATPNANQTDGPLATIQKARDVVRDKKTNQSFSKKIVVRGGTHFLAKPITLTAADSGLTIMAYSGERPILSGGRVIKGWVKSGNLWLAKANWDFRLLRAGDEFYTLARTPNVDEVNPTRGHWAFVDDHANAGFTDHFPYRTGELSPSIRSRQPEIHIFPAQGWVNTILSVTKIDSVTRTVWVKHDSGVSQKIIAGNRYFVSNMYEALDQAGEWWRDQVTDEVFLYPRNKILPPSALIAPVLDRIFDIKGDLKLGHWVSDVTITGFEMRDTSYSQPITVYSPSDAAIHLSAARNCTFANNRLIGVGGYAIKIDQGSTNNTITGNEIGFNGQGGVLLQDTGEDQPYANLIIGNWIHDAGQIYKHVAGVYCNTSSRNRIAHNRIERMPRYGISLKGFDARRSSHHNVVEYNDILMTNLETIDSGAIECLGREKTDSGNIIQFNRIYDVVGLNSTRDGKLLSPHMTWGIYLDDYSSGVTVRGNVVARSALGGIMIHGGRNNLVDNNIFVDGAIAQLWYEPRDVFSVNNRFTRNIVSFSAPNAVLINQMRHSPTRVISQSENNIFWHKTGERFFIDSHAQSPITKLTAAGSLRQWRDLGFDHGSLIADPLFVNASRDDYRLQATSPAFRLGFQQLPWEDMGLAELAPSFPQLRRSLN